MIGEISNTQHSKDNKFRIIQFDSNNKNVQPLYSYSSIINLNRKQSNMTKPNINSRNMMNNIKIKKNHSTIITEINRNSIIKSIDDNVYKRQLISNLPIIADKPRSKVKYNALLVNFNNDSYNNTANTDNKSNEHNYINVNPHQIKNKKSFISKRNSIIESIRDMNFNNYLPNGNVNGDNDTKNMFSYRKIKLNPVNCNNKIKKTTKLISVKTKDLKNDTNTTVTDFHHNVPEFYNDDSDKDDSYGEINDYNNNYNQNNHNNSNSSYNKYNSDKTHNRKNTRKLYKSNHSQFYNMFDADIDINTSRSSNSMDSNNLSKLNMKYKTDRNTDQRINNRNINIEYEDNKNTNDTKNFSNKEKNNFFTTIVHLNENTESHKNNINHIEKTNNVAFKKLNKKYNKQITRNNSTNYDYYNDNSYKDNFISHFIQINQEKKNYYLSRRLSNVTIINRNNINNSTNDFKITSTNINANINTNTTNNLTIKLIDRNIIKKINVNQEFKLDSLAFRKKLIKQPLFFELNYYNKLNNTKYKNKSKKTITTKDKGNQTKLNYTQIYSKLKLPVVNNMSKNNIKKYISFSNEISNIKLIQNKLRSFNNNLAFKNDKDKDIENEYNYDTYKEDYTDEYMIKRKSYYNLLSLNRNKNKDDVILDNEVEVLKMKDYYNKSQYLRQQVLNKIYNKKTDLEFRY